MRNLSAFIPLALFAWSAQPAQADCVGRLEGELRAGGGEYDPFEASDFRRRQTVTIRNTGTTTCSFVVGFRRQPSEGWLTWFLKYRLEDQSGQSLLSENLPPNSGTRYIAINNLAASATATAEFYFVLPRGQFAYPGTFYDSDPSLSLHALSAAGTISSIQLDTRSLLVRQSVKASVGISIAGGGVATTLSFGELAAGKERSVALRTTANYAYSLSLRSANSGVMRLDPEPQGQTWTIPYTLQVNSASVSLQSTASLRKSVSPQTFGQETYWLKFRISEIADRMAGLYRDVVTVDIAVEP
jgi:spore coat protein U-like protein